jgi:hypothetical protein
VKKDNRVVKVIAKRVGGVLKRTFSTLCFSFTPVEWVVAFWRGNDDTMPYV